MFLISVSTYFHEGSSLIIFQGWAQDLGPATYMSLLVLS